MRFRNSALCVLCGFLPSPDGSLEGCIDPVESLSGVSRFSQLTQSVSQVFYATPLLLRPQGTLLHGHRLYLISLWKRKVSIESESRVKTLSRNNSRPKWWSSSFTWINQSTNEQPKKTALNHHFVRWKPLRSLALLVLWVICAWRLSWKARRREACLLKEQQGYFMNSWVSLLF